MLLYVINGSHFKKINLQTELKAFKCISYKSIEKRNEKTIFKSDKGTGPKKHRKKLLQNSIFYLNAFQMLMISLLRFHVVLKCAFTSILILYSIPINEKKILS